MTRQNYFIVILTHWQLLLQTRVVGNLLASNSQLNWMMIISNGQTIIRHLLSLVRHIYRRIYLKTRLLTHLVSVFYKKHNYKCINNFSVDSFAFGVLLYKCYAGQTIIDCSVYDAQRVLQNEKGKHRCEFLR